jgi:Na+-transporting NADH:ubiquinone oxidoreductase subunit NqrC
MKKYIKTILIVVILMALGIGYYYYLSNRTPSSNAVSEDLSKQEIDALTTRNIKNNYPDSPKEVVKLYARITKAYYNTKLTDEQIETLGKQARLLFDDELKNKQTESEFLSALKEDIASYNSKKRYISDYKVETNDNVEYKTLNGEKYASVVVLYYIREGSNLNCSYNKFTLRQDDTGCWKILYWELVNDEYQNKD